MPVTCAVCCLLLSSTLNENPVPNVVGIRLSASFLHKDSTLPPRMFRGKAVPLAADALSRCKALHAASSVCNWNISQGSIGVVHSLSHRS